MSAHSPLRVAVLPPPDQSNPYQRLLHEALARQGVQVHAGPTPTLRWARSAQLNAVHVHWLEFLIHSNRGGPLLARAAGWARTARLLVALRVLRARGVRLVWTVHNLQPHESVDTRLESAAFRAMLRIADTVLVHSDHAAQRVAAALGQPRRLVVAHHPNYVGAYREDAGAHERIRDRLKLPRAARVYLVFGSLRRYKRVPDAITAFREQASETDRLLVVGDAPHADVRTAITAAAAGDARVHLELGYVDDDDVSAWFAAADAVVLNYEEVFSSGALMLALSFGVPVIAPTGGAADEVEPPGAVVTFAEGRLGPALSSRSHEQWRARREDAIAAARRWTWEDMAARLVVAYSSD